MRATWPEEEIGRSSAGPCRAPSTRASRRAISGGLAGTGGVACGGGDPLPASTDPGSVGDDIRRRLGLARVAGAAWWAPPAHDQVDDGRHQDDRADVVHVLQVMTPGLPLVPDLAAEQAQA